MDNPGHFEHDNLPRRFDRPNSLMNVVDGNCVHDRMIRTADRSYHYTASPHDRSDQVTPHDRSDQVLSNDRSGHLNMSSYDRSSKHGKLPERIRKNSSCCNRSLWIGIIVGILLSALVAVPTVYCTTKSCFGTDDTSKSGSYLQLQFDWKTLYPSGFMSEDALKLSNAYSKETPVSSMENPSTLSKYSGVIGNMCFNKNSKIYFEVQYEFQIKGNHSPNNLIFEIGLAERARVDNYHYVGTSLTNGWSYHLYVCQNDHNRTCLLARHNGKNAFDPILWNKISLGWKYTGKFGFIVNRNQEKFSIVQNTSNGGGASLVHPFENVYSTQRLCPVFGVYNPGSFEVKLTLSNTYDFSDDVWNTVFI